jgi:DNA-binding CsgD family transcriptional regulator
MEITSGDDRALLEGSHRLLECRSFGELTETTLQTLLELLHAESCCFGLAYETDDERRLHRVCGHGRITTDDLGSYQAAWWRSDPVLADILSRQWGGLHRIVVLDRLVDMEVFIGSDLYQGFLEPLGIHHVLGLAVSLGDDARALLGVHRPRDHRHGFGARQVALARGLVPAISASYARMLLTEDVRSRESVIDALADGEAHDGVIVLDRHLRVEFADEPACEHLRRLHEAEGEWDVDRRALPSRLRERVACLVDGSRGVPAPDTIRAADFGSAGRVPDLRLRALRSSATTARYLLTFRRKGPPRATRTVLGRLTVREYEIAAHVASGLSSPEIAGALRLSVRTIENHLRTIYAKLELRNRAALAHTLGAVTAH